MKSTVLSILFAIVIIGGTLFLVSGGSNSGVNISDTGTDVPVNNVSVVDGKQIIEIRAKGGYQPRMSIAKAGLPTVLRFNTNGTYDCSAAVRIPSLKIGKMLTATGVTDIDIGVAKSGVLQVMCGMGMYRFEVNFQS